MRLTIILVVTMICLTVLPTPILAQTCNCTGPDLDCGDFSGRSEAQLCYTQCRTEGYGDVFRLDDDNDGQVCEDLQNTGGSTTIQATATSIPTPLPENVDTPIPTATATLVATATPGDSLLPTAQPNSDTVATATPATEPETIPDSGGVLASSTVPIWPIVGLLIGLLIAGVRGILNT